MKIGILYICIGRYKVFWKEFYESCEKHFLLGAEKSYFVFTDAESIEYEHENPNIHRIYQESLPFPYSTLLRFQMFIQQEAALEKMDYLFFFNANTIVYQEITKEEFLPTGEQNLVAVRHSSTYKIKAEYEENEKSLACVPQSEQKYYAQGGLQGGKAKHFLEATREMDKNIQADEKNGVMAVWHDESHWNRYIINRNDVRYLSGSYLFLETALYKSLPAWLERIISPKVILLDKTIRFGRRFLRGQTNRPIGKLQTKCFILGMRMKGAIKKIFVRPR